MSSIVLSRTPDLKIWLRAYRADRGNLPRVGRYEFQLATFARAADVPLHTVLLVAFWNVAANANVASTSVVGAAAD